MKYIFFVLLSLSVVACATNQERTPSSEETDLSQGINADYYGPR